LGALVRIAPPAVEIVLWNEMDKIPAFNPDVEDAHEAGPVGRFRTHLREADAVVFSTPEYAHGIPGSLKNALDWVVGSGELSRKPVVLVNASARGIFVQAALKEVLSTMDARLMTEADLTVDLQGKKLTAVEIAEQPQFGSLLTAFLQNIGGTLNPTGLTPTGA